MTIDWTTFVLEILNFLVLVWILNRFLYRPVLQNLDARRQRLQDEATKAERLQQEAAALKTQYEERLSDWNREREEQRRKLEEELAQLRSKGLDALKKSLADEEAKARARADTVAAARDAALVREAAGKAYGAAAAMLRRLASPELTRHIVAVFCEDLGQLPEAELAALHNAVRALDAEASIDIATAHELDETSRAIAAAALEQAAGRPLRTNFNVAPELLAGLRAAVGECLLRANLADELAFFARQDNHAR